MQCEWFFKLLFKTKIKTELKDIRTKTEKEKSEFEFARMAIFSVVFYAS